MEPQGRNHSTFHLSFSSSSLFSLFSLFFFLFLFLFLSLFFFYYCGGELRSEMRRRFYLSVRGEEERNISEAICGGK